MFCMHCGAEVPEGAKVCPACGEELPAAPARHAAPAPVRHESYEYARTTVKSDLATVATDCYESLGFELTGSKGAAASDSTALSFRRSRKVTGKAQLAKLQRTADDLLARIATLEGEKTSRACVLSLATGILSALVLGVGMCFCMVWTQFMLLGIVIGIVGIAGCVGTLFFYRSIVAKDTARVAPQIEAAYDQLATVCEEGQSVLAMA